MQALPVSSTLAAAKRGIGVHGVEVEVTGTFGSSGEAARDISYRVRVGADAPKTTIDDLIRASRTPESGFHAAICSESSTSLFADDEHARIKL